MGRSIADATVTVNGEVWVSQVVHELPSSTLAFQQRDPQRLPSEREIDVFAAVA